MATRNTSRTRTTLERRGRLVFGVFILLTVVAGLAWPWWQMGSLARLGDIDRAWEKVQAYLQHVHDVQLAQDTQKAESLHGMFLPEAENLRVIRIAPAPPGEQRVPEEIEAESFEAEAIRTFLAEPETAAHHREVDDKLHYVQPVRARSECLDCHGSGYREGALIGAVSLQMDVARRGRTLLAHRMVLTVAAVLVVLISMALFYAVFRTMVVRPIQHLKDVADRVTEGDLQVRSGVDTGNELETLSRAMNRMLDEMLETQTELQEANEVRDAKLDELAKANVALFEMNQVKNKFLTTMSHELRTPLNSILGFAQILTESEKVAEDPKLGRYAENIQRSGQMLLEMINDLLDLAKIEAGRVQVRCEKVSPQSIVEAAVSMVRPMLGEKDLALEAEVDPSLPVMTTDATKVQQILYNLLSNAVKFTEEGEVRVIARPDEGDRAAFVVSDTGPGIEREQQLRIFERFAQLDSSYTRRYRGTGLGLSIVKELTALLGGEVGVESEVGEGSTFTVVLPLDSSGLEGRTPEDAAEPTEELEQPTDA
jgi:signal transduction histidine kinase